MFVGKVKFAVLNLRLKISVENTLLHFFQEKRVFVVFWAGMPESR